MSITIVRIIVLFYVLPPMGKPRFTEEFLWSLHRIFEELVDVHEVAGVRSMSDVVAPEMRKLRFEYEKKQRKKTFSQFVSYLKARGYIKIPEGKSISFFQLTEKGRRRAFEGQARTAELPLRKDGKMIMLMFDIPKNKDRVRHVFRSRLEFLGYQMLQKSVWISSKDVLEETERAVREYDLEGCVNLFVIEKIQLEGKR
ncbi:MAG: CRISPR-associated endonuclease Cas2 [Candidatus Wildermuthbacteria bacterium]|nr:CRISPR-associated endonuclease Cas2 [Candidatus Wildermuthbacteria bacterium]